MESKIASIIEYYHLLTLPPVFSIIVKIDKTGLIQLWSFRVGIHRNKKIKMYILQSKLNSNWNIPWYCDRSGNRGLVLPSNKSGCIVGSREIETIWNCVENENAEAAAGEPLVVDVYVALLNPWHSSINPMPLSEAAHRGQSPISVVTPRYAPPITYPLLFWFHSPSGRIHSIPCAHYNGITHMIVEELSMTTACMWSVLFKFAPTLASEKWTSASIEIGF